MDFFARQDASLRATRYLVLLFGLAFVAVGLATGIALLILLGLVGEATAPSTVAVSIDDAGMLAIVVAVVVGMMTLASLFRSATLSRGGGQVARMLGATQIQSDDEDLLHRRLLNVVEEMAIASGLPVPEVYVLERERGINAFAAGLTPADAAVAVTRGSLEQLNRAELQGVIAHEFSHILNGDMRLNLRLMGFSFGILVLTLVGRWLLRASGHGMRMRMNSRKGNPTLLIGIALVVIGGIGVLLSRLIKAAVSRQRESLADASAVQFTREPLALAGALKKIGGLTPHLETVDAEEVSHMLFGRAGKSFVGWFATHPPLDERISALDPTFDPGDYTAPAEPAAQGTVASARGTSLGLVGGQAQASGIDLGRAGSIQAEAGSRLHAAIPADLQDAVHGRESAYLLVLALGLEPGGASPAQLRILESHFGKPRTARCRQLRNAIDSIDRVLWLPLFELAVPALKQRPGQQIEYLFEVLNKLAESDNRLTLHEYLLGRLLHAYFEALGLIAVPAHASRPRVRNEAIAMLVATLAHAGNRDLAQATAALEAGLQTIDATDLPASETLLERARVQSRFSELDRALGTLSAAPLRVRRSALVALSVTLRHDHTTTIAEAEIFRTVAAVLGCPVPPTIVIG